MDALLLQGGGLLLFALGAGGMVYSLLRGFQAAGHAGSATLPDGVERSQAADVGLMR